MIEEIPIEENAPREISPEEIASEIPEPEAQIPKPKPKAKGRPKGSLGKKKKEQGDDVPQKIQKQKAKPQPPSESEEEEPQPKKKRKVVQREPSPDSRSVYEPPDTRVIAAEVLQLLSNRHLDRSTAKREKYRSWFANPV